MAQEKNALTVFADENIAASLGVNTDDLVAYVVSETERGLRAQIDAAKAEIEQLNAEKPELTKTIEADLLKQATEKADVVALVKAMKPFGFKPDFHALWKRRTDGTPYVDVTVAFKNDLRAESGVIASYEFSTAEIKKAVARQTEIDETVRSLQERVVQLRAQTNDIPRLQRETRGIIAKQRLASTEGGKAFIERVSAEMLGKYVQPAAIEAKVVKKAAKKKT